ncbi:MAG: HAD-IA family hydrolase [Candidatus Acetothermia bacterium]|jgi:HAD superfamily hydrolase (TIGR01509 family)|nr:HAD-IA family hydrolase [Candidatus Acetothermia bacterium]MDH7505165.1 HAD-IA family hydrolase [Candidatus Acetothermia bacterium]
MVCDRAIRGLIFDFDGLILDTEWPTFRSLQEICQEHGCSISLSTWASYIGTSREFDLLDYLEAQLGRPLDREAIAAKHRRRELELIRLQTTLPGVESYISEAKRLGLKLGLASSSSRQWVTEHLARLGLAREFDSLKCAEDVRETKPSPDLYRAVLAELGLNPAQAVALEDSPNGILAAKRAGLLCVAVPNALTRQLSLELADLRLESLAELPLAQLLPALEKIRRAPWAP